MVSDFEPGARPAGYLRDGTAGRPPPRPRPEPGLYSDPEVADAAPVRSFRDVVGPPVDEQVDNSYEAADAFFDLPTGLEDDWHPSGQNGRSTLNDEAESFDDDPEDELDYEAYFEDDEDDEELLEATSNVTRNALEWAVVLVGAVLVALLLRASLFQAFYIPSESMENTLLINDRVLVNKVSYRLHDINRGDIVVFARPDDQEGEIRDLIKRVIALPGETVEATDNSLYINGQRLIEPYLDEGIVTTDFGPTVIAEDQIFVMGDNRSESYDSRVFGTIAQDRVVGRAFVLFWPLNRIGSL